MGVFIYIPTNFVFYLKYIKSSYFYVALMKYPDKCNIMEKGLHFVSQLQVNSPLWQGSYGGNCSP